AGRVLPGASVQFAVPLSRLSSPKVCYELEQLVGRPGLVESPGHAETGGDRVWLSRLRWPLRGSQPERGCAGIVVAQITPLSAAGQASHFPVHARRPEPDGHVRLQTALESRKRPSLPIQITDGVR